MALWAALHYTLLPSMDTSRSVQTLSDFVRLLMGRSLHGHVDSTILLIVAQHECQSSGTTGNLDGVSM